MRRLAIKEHRFMRSRQRSVRGHESNRSRRFTMLLIEEKAEETIYYVRHADLNDLSNNVPNKTDNSIGTLFINPLRWSILLYLPIISVLTDF